MKKSRKVLALLMATAALSTVSLSACGGRTGGGASDSGNGGDITVQTDKTQLYIFNYDGGLGHTWTDTLIKRFEETYANEVFEEGKKGVQVIPTYKKDANGWGGDGLISNLPDAQESIIFTESVYYNDLIKAGVVKDITEWVTTPLTEYGETRSIADKIRGTQKTYMNRDGKYYALPFWEGYAGMFYDVELFTQKNLFIAATSPADGQGETVFVTSSSDAKSVGPNGVSGDSDDGLPRTYNEFFDLLNEMKTNAGIKYPVSFPGVDNGYVSLLGSSMANDYAGYDASMANYTFTGEIEVIDGDVPETVTYDKSALKTKKVNVTLETGYELAKQSSRYYALDFIKTLMNGDGVYS